MLVLLTAVLVTLPRYQGARINEVNINVNLLFFALIVLRTPAFVVILLGNASYDELNRVENHAFL